MFPGENDKLPDMIDNALFEGISDDLKTALVAGYGAILEGVGDARIASFLFRHLIPEITSSVFNQDTIHRIYEMVNSTEIYEVTVYESQADQNAAGYPLTIKFTRSSGKPTFIRQHDVIEIPIMRSMEHSIFKVAKAKVRGNPLYLTEKMPFPAFVAQMKKAWTEKTALSYEAVSIRESILRELSIWLAENRKPETIRNPEKKYAKEDAEYVEMLNKEAEGKTVDKSLHEWKDANLRPVYRAARMDSGDARALASGRGWATQDVMHRHKEITDKIRRNWTLGRKALDGVTKEEQKFLEAFRERAKKYNQSSYLATNRELQARITALIPGLVKLQSEKGELPMKETLSDMLDKVFDLPKDGPGIVGNERRFAKSCILPGAFRSASRRCAELIDAANHMFYTYDMPLGEKIERLVKYMEQNATDEQVSRQI